MGDVPSGKVNSSRGAEGTTLAPEPDASKPTPGSATENAGHPTRPAQANQYSNPSYMGHGRYEPSSMIMNHMAFPLPNPQSQPSSFEPHLANQFAPAPTQGIIYPMQSMSPYPGQTPGGVPYGIPYNPAYPPYSLAQHPGTAPHGGGHYPSYVATPSLQPMSTGQAPIYGSGYYAHPFAAPYGHGTPPLTGPIQPRPQARQGSRGPLPANTPKEDRRLSELDYDVSKTIVDGSNPSRLAQGPLLAADLELLMCCVLRRPSFSPHPVSTSSTPRGPPRKPKQSGNALWVGNLPPGANVIDLKDHFSQDATNDIESVFLISKSNCAFVNYKSAIACAAALGRFHDSRFQGVRLVCRLRKGFTVPGSGSAGQAPRRSEENTDIPDEEPLGATDFKPVQPLEDGTRSSDRYFIVKSLTVEDLELSKQSGIWATQSHNETNLNEAFKTTEHVYLIFSANKSGEYFGYARMLSPISDDEELALEMPARPEPVPGNTEELEVTPTLATSTAPKGRIIDDSARGTIFWEVESLEDEHNDARSEKSEAPVEEAETDGQTFGKPFRIQWLSTGRVPFHRTRGLRNPWNANREVKIARDGTEIEPTVGRKLLQLFHQT
ncbi:Nucleotide-binding alpha-beta plait [Penicillium longicatenatum]|uniref:Nucleotide-binding alpha-beta plait n=1 Tax=Penicillium longicatenatum TaxID=1561947 RepID=UPI0025468AE7|nr:Nucleotide-binding alpha-beta plait [Penicillium longicatenatum]KAJ5630528.1 Nucleotide-binding alpha-beta plait [Penicillium longicatenatum]